MKKISLLAIALITSSLFTSCKSSSSVPIIVQKTSEEGLALIKMIKETDTKESLQEGEKWNQLWGAALNRKADFLDTSWADELKRAKEALPEVGSACQKYDYEFVHGDSSFKTYYFTNDNYQRVIIYLHGGAYFNNIASNHIKTCYALSKKFNAKVYMPLYPIIPNKSRDDYRICYAFLEKFYERVTGEESDKNKDFIFMGDSAGGGLTLGFTQYLAHESPLAKLPIARVCSSPWCDITLTNPEASKKDKDDIFLSMFGLRKFGVEWAGMSTTIIDYRLSPIYGPLDDKIDTIIFSGTDEIFYPDSLETAKILFKNGVRTKFVQGDGLFHVYPIFYSLPEANEAIQIAYDFIVNKK